MADMFQRKYKEDRPVVAICYDFDKTLSPDNMQAQGYLQAINYENQDEPDDLPYRSPRLERSAHYRLF